MKHHIHTFLNYVVNGIVEKKKKKWETVTNFDTMIKEKIETNKSINKEKNNKYFTLITEGSSWFMGSGYIVNKKSAKLLYDNIIKNKCTLPIDNEIGYLIKKLNLKSYFYNFKLVQHNFGINSLITPGRRKERKK